MFLPFRERSRSRSRARSRKDATHPSRTPGQAVALLCVSALAGCSKLAEPELRSQGVGAPCRSDGECHAARCEKGLCTVPCGREADCPAPAKCFADLCQLPIDVGALWVGVVSGGEGWTLTHQDGLEATRKALPYVSVQFRENIVGADAVGKTIDDFVVQGKDLILANSFSQRDAVLERAARYPHKRFAIVAGFKNAPNVSSVFGHMEQAWYVAGRVAAARATRRIGVVAALITPEVVRHVNAFTLGARAANPTLVVEVAWLGFWYDYRGGPMDTYAGTLARGGSERVYREELLAYRLLESGCEVVGHLADNQRVTRLVERLTLEGRIHDRWGMANDNRDGCRELTPAGTAGGAAMVSCLGVPYWNWAPLYTRLIEQIHTGTWDPKVLVNEPLSAVEDSVVGFNLNPASGVDAPLVRGFLAEAAQAGPERVFTGPYATTGQRDVEGDGVPDATQALGPGERVSEAEFLRMCWFVEGVVEKQNPLDPLSPDVPARVPDGQVPPPPDVLGPPGAPPGVGLSCLENR